MPRKRSWTDEQLETAVAGARNFNETMLALGLAIGNKNRERVRDRARELGLDTSHFRWGRGFDRRTFDPFVKGVEFNTTTKRYYMELVEYKCVLCGISEWLGNPLILQVDHVDGDRTNNTLENLRLLCPNCHSQTETWSKKKANKE